MQDDDPATIQRPGEGGGGWGRGAGGSGGGGGGEGGGGGGRGGGWEVGRGYTM